MHGDSMLLRKLHQIEAMGFRADYMSPTGW
jgi:hypothetical protein